MKRMSPRMIGQPGWREARKETPWSSRRVGQFFVTEGERNLLRDQPIQPAAQRRLSVSKHMAALLSPRRTAMPFMMGGKLGQWVAKELEMKGPNSVFSWAAAGA